MAKFIELYNLQNRKLLIAADKISAISAIPDNKDVILVYTETTGFRVRGNLDNIIKAIEAETAIASVKHSISLDEALTKEEPKFEKVYRQSEDSSILEIATDARNSISPYLNAYKEETRTSVQETANQNLSKLSFLVSRLLPSFMKSSTTGLLVTSRHRMTL